MPGVSYHQPEKSFSCVNRRAGLRRGKRRDSASLHRTMAPGGLLFTGSLSPGMHVGGFVVFNYFVTRVPFNQKHGNNVRDWSRVWVVCYAGFVPIIPARDLFSCYLSRLGFCLINRDRPETETRVRSHRRSLRAVTSALDRCATVSADRSNFLLFSASSSAGRFYRRIEATQTA